MISCTTTDSLFFFPLLGYFAYVSDLKRQTQRVTLTLLKRISSTFAGELAVVLPAGLVAADDAADLLTVLVLDDRVAAARVAPDAAALPEAGRVRQARGDVGRAAKSADVTKVMSNLQGSASYFRLPYFAFLIFVRWPKHALGTTFEGKIGQPTLQRFKLLVICSRTECNPDMILILTGSNTVEVQLKEH